VTEGLPHMPLFRSKEFENRSKRGKYGDNGPWEPYLEQGGSAGLLRGAKGSTWEGGMRVPGIFWWPGAIKPGVVTGIGSELDLLQTFAAIAGARAPAGRDLDGYDLSPTLRTASPSPRDVLFYYASRAGTPLVAVRQSAFKLHLQVPQARGRGAGAAATGAAGGSEPAMELYNLDEDPSEKFNLAAARPEVVARFKSVAEAHTKAVVPGPNQLGRRSGG
jgi:arylsulfatase A